MILPRTQFTSFDQESDFVFASNAGGSYVAKHVNRIVQNYNQYTRVQPYERYTCSAEAGLAMDRARVLWKQALNIDDDELTIGPSTSMNTYVLAQAIGVGLKPDDEIVVTNQDHEANSGVWRRMAEQQGILCKEWRVDPSTGLLDPDALAALLTDNTRWVFFTHCSNIVGTVNPVAELVQMIKARSNARVFVDAVAYAPHHICDMQALGVDGYVFSLYKVYGPHQSLMYLRRECHDQLQPQCHYFNTDKPAKRFNPAGPQHCQVAACAGVIDYFSALYQHHYGLDKNVGLRQQLHAIHRLILNHENRLAAPILDYLHRSEKVFLIGKNYSDDDRAPTIAFVPRQQRAYEVAGKMQQQNIGTESGDFYARRLITDLGISPDDGVVRISLLHYTTEQDVEKIVRAIDNAL